MIFTSPQVLVFTHKDQNIYGRLQIFHWCEREWWSVSTCTSWDWFQLPVGCNRSMYGCRLEVSHCALHNHEGLILYFKRTSTYNCIARSCIVSDLLKEDDKQLTASYTHCHISSHLLYEWEEEKQQSTWATGFRYEQNHLLSDSQANERTYVNKSLQAFNHSGESHFIFSHFTLACKSRQQYICLCSINQS